MSSFALFGNFVPTFDTSKTPGMHKICCCIRNRFGLYYLWDSCHSFFCKCLPYRTNEQNIFFNRGEPIKCSCSISLKLYFIVKYKKKNISKQMSINFDMYCILLIDSRVHEIMELEIGLPRNYFLGYEQRHHPW